MSDTARTTPAAFRLSVLGPVTVQQAGDPPSSSRLTQPRHLALLSYLVLARPRGLHARDTLMALLWPDHDASRGRQALRNALHGIRRQLGHAALVSAGEGLIGVNPAMVVCDACDLERGVLPADGVDGGTPFHGFHVDGAHGFADWLSNEQARLRSLLDRGAAGTTTSVSAGSGTSRASAPSPHLLDAFALYSRGHYLFMRAAPGGSTDDLLRSRDCFARALVLDAQFAPALAGLANFYAVAARRGVLTPFHETFARTIEYSRQALALDDQLAIPYVHFAVEALYLTEDFEAAGRAFAKAVQVEPAYAEGHRFFGVWLGMAGRHAEALARMAVAVRLEPDIPFFLSSLAAAQLMVGDAASGEATLRRTLDIEPAYGPARERLLRVLEDAQRYDEAMGVRRAAPVARGLDAFERAWATQGAAGYQEVRTALWRAEAETLAARVAEGAPPTVAELFAPPVVRLVACLVHLGELRKARAWKLQACAERPILTRWFAALPEAAPL